MQIMKGCNSICWGFVALIWILGNETLAFTPPPCTSSSDAQISQLRGISIGGGTATTATTTCISIPIYTNCIHRMGKVSSSSLSLVPAMSSIRHRSTAILKSSESVPRAADNISNNALYQTSTAQNNDGDASSSQQQKQTTLTKWYSSASMLYFSHVLVSLLTNANTVSSPLVRCLHDIGGPIMCTGVMLLLKKASSSLQQSQNHDDTWKRLNGLMVLHSSLVLGLGLMALYFKFGVYSYGPGSKFGFSSYGYWGTLLAAAGTSGYAAIRGYLQSMTNTSEFLKETDRLLGEANQLITKLPNSLSSLGPIVTLWTIAALKASLVWNVAQAILQKSSLQAIVFTNLRQFCQLTILGGSLVSANSKKVSKQVSSVLHFLSSYVLGTMAATTVSQASSLEFAKGCWLASCSVAIFLRGTGKEFEIGNENR